VCGPWQSTPLVIQTRKQKWYPRQQLGFGNRMVRSGRLTKGWLRRDPMGRCRTARVGNRPGSRQHGLASLDGHRQRTHKNTDWQPGASVRHGSSSSNNDTANRPLDRGDRCSAGINSPLTWCSREIQNSCSLMSAHHRYTTRISVARWQRTMHSPRLT